MKMSDWIKHRSKFYSDREIHIVDQYDNILYTGGMEGLAEFKGFWIRSITDFDGVLTIRVEG